MNILKNNLFIFLALFFLMFISCDYSGTAPNSVSMEAIRLDSIAQLYHKGNVKSCFIEGLIFAEDFPENDKGWHILSSAALKLKKDSLAEIFANNAIILNPKNHIALLNLGILLDKKDNYEEAQEFYEKSLEISPSFLQTYSNYAGNRLLAGDYDVAVKLGKKAVLLGNNIEDKAILCMTYHEMNNFNERDSLLNELRMLDYKNLEELKNYFKSDQP